MGSLVCPCCCCCYFRAAVRCLHCVVQLKSIAIEERPMWRLHWSAFSSQRKCVWQLTRFASRKWRSGLNRISHPDWVKLSVELNLHAKPKYEFSLPLHCLMIVVVRFGTQIQQISEDKPSCHRWYSPLDLIPYSFKKFNSLKNWFFPSLWRQKLTERISSFYKKPKNQLYLSYFLIEKS